MLGSDLPGRLLASPSLAQDTKENYSNWLTDTSSRGAASQTAVYYRILLNRCTLEAP